MENTILTAGNAVMDVLLNVPYAPHDGRLVCSKDRYMFTPGGSGAYTAVAARRAGASSILCARIGDDEMGVRISEHLKDADAKFSLLALSQKGGHSKNTFKKISTFFGQ